MCTRFKGKVGFPTLENNSCFQCHTKESLLLKDVGNGATKKVDLSFSFIKDATIAIGVIIYGRNWKMSYGLHFLWISIFTKVPNLEHTAYDPVLLKSEGVLNTWRFPLNT